jgi:tRNA(Ser,Leu) C12 N-acetylase TAN1
MKDWNIIVTTPPGQERELLPALNRLGEFTRSDFKGILIGRVEDVTRFLEDILHAGEEHVEWRPHLLRVLPVERTFSFTPQTFEERLREAVVPFVQRMVSGTFHVRLERRGHKGKILSPEVERRLGDDVMDLAMQQGKTLHVSFQDADYIIVAETVSNLCGVALVTRELRTRYPFVKIR